MGLSKERSVAPLMDKEIEYIDTWLRNGQSMEEIRESLGFGEYSVFVTALARRGYKVARCLVQLSEEDKEEIRQSNKHKRFIIDRTVDEEYMSAFGTIFKGRDRPKVRDVIELLDTLLTLVKGYGQKVGLEERTKISLFPPRRPAGPPPTKRKTVVVRRKPFAPKRVP